MDEVDKSKLREGTQIAYVPTHAKGNLKHPDVQFGFVTSVKADHAFCRYWRGRPEKSLRPFLRTLSNSEATPFDCMVIVDSTEQVFVDQALLNIKSV